MPVASMANTHRLLLAGVVWSVAGVLGAPGAVFAVLVGLIAIGLRISERWGRPQGVFVVVVLSVVAALASELVHIPDVSAIELAIWLGPPLIVGAFGIFQPVLARSLHPWFSVGLVAAVFISALGVMVEHAGTNVGVDVYLSHVAAAEALAEGENPYTDAVRYPNGSPFAAEGEVLEGYGYPPITLWSYAASTWLTGDPRWLNVAAWVGTIAALLVRIHRRRAEWVIPFAVVLAAFPAWRLVVFTGWTEPLTIALLVATAFAWRRCPIASGLLLGLALASKQYMILLLPLLAFHRDESQIHRVTVAGSTAIATLVPYAIADFELFFDRLVTRPLSFGYRPDTQSLPGLFDRLGVGPEIPLLVPIAAVLVVSWVVTRRPFGPDSFLIGTATVLAVFFVLSLAFANYWFLVSGLLVAGAALGGDAEPMAAE